MDIESLLHEEEGTSLDFKSAQYKFENSNPHIKSELLKDILAFANSWRRGDAYILIGVKEVKGGRSIPLGIDKDLDDADLQEFVNKKTQKPIIFSYKTLRVSNKKIALIHIPIQERPIFLKNNYGKLKKDVVYIRRGSSTDEASPDEIIEIGKENKEKNVSIPNISLNFANLKKREVLGKDLKINKIKLITTPFKDIPDYDTSLPDPFNITIQRGIPENRNFYRDLILFYSRHYDSEPLGISLKNDSDLPISNVKLEIIISKDDKYDIFHDDDYPKWPERDLNLGVSLLSEHLTKKLVKVVDLEDRYLIEIDFEKIPPKQVVFSKNPFYITAKSNFLLNLEYTIYADNLPSPIKSVVKIECMISEEQASIEKIEDNLLDLEKKLEQM